MKLSYDVSNSRTQNILLDTSETEFFEKAIMRNVVDFIDIVVHPIDEETCEPIKEKEVAHITLAPYEDDYDNIVVDFDTWSQETYDAAEALVETKEYQRKNALEIYNSEEIEEYFENTKLYSAALFAFNVAPEYRNQGIEDCLIEALSHICADALNITLRCVIVHRENLFMVEKEINGENYLEPDDSLKSSNLNFLLNHGYSSTKTPGYYVRDYLERFYNNK